MRLGRQQPVQGRDRRPHLRASTLSLFLPRALAMFLMAITPAPAASPIHGCMSTILRCHRRCPPRAANVRACVQCSARWWRA
jgi:hypothetical protein